VIAVNQDKLGVAGDLVWKEGPAEVSQPLSYLDLSQMPKFIAPVPSHPVITFFLLSPPRSGKAFMFAKSKLIGETPSWNTHAFVSDFGIRHFNGQTPSYHITHLSQVCQLLALCVGVRRATTRRSSGGGVLQQVPLF
jgi:hypothetical protein